MKINKLLLVAIVVLAISCFIAIPYITVHKIKVAVEKGDEELLLKHIDLPSVRQNLKDQIKTMLLRKMSEEGSPFTPYDVPYVLELADRGIDTYVTPEGIAKIIRGRRLDLKEYPQLENDPIGEPFRDARLSFRSPSEFVIVTRNEEGKEVHFVLRRQGIDWNLSEIVFY